MNFTNRKFLNADVQDVVSGSEVNIAELMAKHGVQNSSDTMVATPIDIQEKQEEPKTEAPKPVEPTNSEAKVEEVKTESPVTEKIEEVPQTQKAAEQPKSQTWQEVLKSQQPDIVFKELGLDDSVVSLIKELKDAPKEMVALLNHWRANNGDVTEYLRELTTDYSKMPAEEVMRHQLRKDYPKASEKQIDVLFKKEVVEKYGLDSEDESELEEGKLLLETKAEKFRDDFILNQKNFLLPKPTEPKDVVDNTEQLKQQEFDRYKEQVNNHPVTRDLITNKHLVIGEGEDKFTLPIQNPSELLETLFDDANWSKKLFDVKLNENGQEVYKPNMPKQLLVSAILNDDVYVFRELAKYYKSLGGKAAIDPIDNAKPIDTTTASKSEANPTNAAEAMAKSGRLV